MGKVQGCSEGGGGGSVSSGALDDAFGSTQGSILYRNATEWTVLTPGTTEYFLQTNGSGANPEWSNTLLSPVINGTVTTTGLTLPAFTAGGAITFAAGVAAPQILGPSDLALTIRGASSRNLVLGAGGSDVFTIASGAVTTTLNDIGLGVGGTPTGYTRFLCYKAANEPLIFHVQNATSGTGAYAGLTISADGGGAAFNTYSSAYSTSGMDIADAASLYAASTLSGGLTVGTHAAAPLMLFTNGTERARFLSTGDFLIGRTTAISSRFVVFQKDQNAASLMSFNNNTSGTAAYAGFETVAAGASLTYQSFSSGFTSSGSAQATGNRIFSSGAGGLYVVASDAGPLVFYGGSSTVEVARFDGSTGRFQLNAGTGTERAKPGGTIDYSTTQTGNVGTGEDDLVSYSIAASTLSSNGDAIVFEAAGTFTASANNKRLRVKWGATTIFDSTALAITAAGDWWVKATIVRTGAATQKCLCVVGSNDALLVTTPDYTTATETLSGAVTLKITGEATSNNDLVHEMSSVEWRATP